LNGQVLQSQTGRGSARPQPLSERRLVKLGQTRQTKDIRYVIESGTGRGDGTSAGSAGQTAFALPLDGAEYLLDALARDTEAPANLDETQTLGTQPRGLSPAGLVRRSPAA